MTHMPTAVRLRDVDTSDVIVDLHDHDNGVTVLEAVDVPGATRRYAREKYARVTGSFRVGPSLADDGALVVRVRVEGDTWAQATTRFVSLLEDLQGSEEFFVETELDGVRTRWYCDAPPDVLPEPITVTARILRRQEYEVRFLVQPNPSITIV